MSVPDTSVKAAADGKPGKPAPMRGFFSMLTEAQRAAIRSYRGNDNVLGMVVDAASSSTRDDRDNSERAAE